VRLDLTPRGRRRLRRRASRVARLAGHAARSALDRYRPVMVQIIPMRRCNLACGYCNEYDDVSKPVPVEIMKSRIDHLAGLGLAILTFSGGEPLMHPELPELVAHARARGLFATMITNGYLLSRETIERLNDAGLDHMQISIDNAEPDAVSMKSLRLLEPKLRWLAEHADFEININAVLGSAVKNPLDALSVWDRAAELGFTRTVGILHDGNGQLQPLAPEQMKVYEELRRRADWASRWFNSNWQDNLARGKPNEWSCRAGSRYLYVDEFGLVHYCSQQRGAPGLPLEAYRREHLEREYFTKKACAPYCTVNCVQQSSLFDNWRGPQTVEARLVPLRVISSGLTVGRGQGSQA
jgi:MoaA/NifB/PqqE/SkfB family radical SAM enzyme